MNVPQSCDCGKCLTRLLVQISHTHTLFLFLSLAVQRPHSRSIWRRELDTKKRDTDFASGLTVLRWHRAVNAFLVGGIFVSANYSLYQYFSILFLSQLWQAHHLHIVRATPNDNICHSWNLIETAQTIIALQTGKIGLYVDGSKQKDIYFLLFLTRQRNERQTPLDHCGPVHSASSTFGR